MSWSNEEEIKATYAKVKNKRLTDDELIELLPAGDWEVESTLLFARAVEAKTLENNHKL